MVADRGSDGGVLALGCGVVAAHQALQFGELADHGFELSDRVVPAPFQWRVANAYAGEKRIIVQRDAGHDSHLDDVGHAQLREGMDWLFDRATSAE